MTSDLEQLLARLATAGVEVRVDGEQLRFTARDPLTPELRGLLVAHKAELIEYLRTADAQPRLYPASFVQRRFWALQRLNPDKPFYIVPFVFRLLGTLDVETLRQSLNAIVRRHQSLRTTLREVAGELMQVVAPEGEIALIVTRDPRQLEIEMNRPFDLANEPGLRVVLLDAGGGEYLLQLCLHNTLFDQSSLLVLLKELSAYYSGQSLPAPVQYSEYERRQRALLTHGMEERLAYWRRWFGRGMPPVWTWQFPPPPDARPGDFDAHVTRLHFSLEAARSLRALSQRSGVTPFITLFAAYAALLRRYTGCSDLTIGTTYSNRHQWDFESLIGAAIDVPAIRVDMTDNPRAAELLTRVRDAMGGALTYQDVPFDLIAPNLDLERKIAGPLFRVVFSFFGETPHDRLRLPGVEVTFLEDRINQASRPDLYLVLWERDGGHLEGYWMHRKNVFTAETAARMNADFRALLDRIVIDPTKTPDDFPDRPPIRVS